MGVATEGTERLPYVRGLMTTSIIILIYIWGEGSIDNQLTIAIVGLTLSNPSILELFIGLAFIWYLWRFATNNPLELSSEIKLYANKFLRNQSNDMNSLKSWLIENNESYQQNMETIEVDNIRMFLKWDVLERNTGTLDETVICTLPATALLRLKLKTVLTVLFMSGEFADKYIPWFVAIMASLSAVISIGLSLAY